MQPTNFKASVQYDDFKGTAAADEGNNGDARDWLVKKGPIQEGEFLLGITLFAGENHGSHQDPLFVEFLLATPGDHNAARERWMAASNHASVLASQMHQSGSGYGDPDARMQDEHQLQSVRHDVERFFREYDDLAQKDMEQKLLEVQRSQRLATWASFAVAAVVGPLS